MFEVSSQVRVFSRRARIARLSQSGSFDEGPVEIKVTTELVQLNINFTFVRNVKSLQF